MQRNKIVQFLFSVFLLLVLTSYMVPNDRNSLIDKNENEFTPFEVPLIQTSDPDCDPIILKESPTQDVIQSNTPVDISVTDPLLDTVFYNWDGNDNISWSEPYITNAPISEGNHYLNVYANNTKGSEINCTFIFIVDDTPPFITVNPYLYGSPFDPTLVDIDIEELHISEVLYRWGNGQYISWTSPYHTNEPAGSGPHAINVFAIDIAGNFANESFIFGDYVRPEPQPEPEEEPDQDQNPYSNPFVIPGYNYIIILGIIGMGIYVLTRRMKR